jgi:hypothetical protein
LYRYTEAAKNAAAAALKAADEQADAAADDKSLSRAQKSQFFQAAGDRAEDSRDSEAAAKVGGCTS